MTKIRWAVIITVALVVGVDGRQEPVDAAANARIRDEGLNRSHVAEPFDMFVNVIGPRLTGSPSHKRAADYARATLEKWGMTNAHLESWEFGSRGWELEKLTIEMVEPRYMPLIGYAEAWTPSTHGELVVTAVSTAGKTADEIAVMPIAGAALLTQPVITNFIDRDRQQPELVEGARIGAPSPPTQGPRPGAAAAAGAGAPPAITSITSTGSVQPAPARQGPAGATGALRGAGGGVRGNGNPAFAKAAVLIKPSLGMHGTVFVQSQNRDTPTNTQPAIVLAAEHYNIIARLIEHNIPVKLRVNVQTKFFDEGKTSYNVVADIPGTDPVLKDQIVLLAGHLDSWHAGTGATDNADGAAEVMEAFRILKAAGLQPKRTLRVALWGGEEEGLFGSKAYVASHLEGDAHKAEHDKMDVYFNIDPGTGPIYGWYMENSAAAKTIFDAWLAPFADLGARKNIMPGIGNTDHLSFIGIPGFNPIQDYTDYDVRLHHTNADTAERVKEVDLRQCAVVLASFAYHAAQRAEMIPRGK